MGKILAIDPGNERTGYVLVEYDFDKENGEGDITKVLEAGKELNYQICPIILYKRYDHFAIEMVAGMGMPVGQEVFDTCFEIGRFWEWAQASEDGGWNDGLWMKKIYRREEKLDLCGSPNAKDANIRQALVDRYAPGQPNFGKGTKKDPGFFYGFSADMWAAMAVAVTYFDKYIKGVKL